MSPFWVLGTGRGWFRRCLNFLFDHNLEVVPKTGGEGKRGANRKHEGDQGDAERKPNKAGIDRERFDDRTVISFHDNSADTTLLKGVTDHILEFLEGGVEILLHGLAIESKLINASCARCFFRFWIRFRCG